MQETKESGSKRSRKNPSNRWEDLDPDILKGILSRIPPDNLFLEASCVCHAWRSAAWDFLFWSRNVIDLNFALPALNKFSSIERTPNLLRLYSRQDFPGKYPSPSEYDKMAAKLTKLLKLIMEGNDAYGHSLGDWSHSIHTIIIPYDLELSDDHLLYIAERAPGLKHLSLLGTHKITAGGFTKVIQKWKFLKSLHLGPIKYEKWYTKIMQEIGKSCKGFEEIYIHHDEVIINESKPLAMDIVRNLPGLKKVGFEGALIFRSGLSFLFYKCPQLQEIDVFECSLCCNIILDRLTDKGDREEYCMKSTFGLERKQTTDDDYKQGFKWCVKDSSMSSECLVRFKDLDSATTSMMLVRYIYLVQLHYGEVPWYYF